MKKKIIISIMVISLFLIGMYAVSANEWTAGTYYNIGDIVSYQGTQYKCIQAHTAQIGWTPLAVPALWSVYNPPVNDGSWQVGVSYNIGDEVTYNNVTYIARQAHISQSDWIPTITPALWEVNINPTYSNELKNFLENKYNTTTLKDWNILKVDKSIKVISYNIQLENKYNNSLKKNVTWLQVNN